MHASIPALPSPAQPCLHLPHPSCTHPSRSCILPAGWHRCLLPQAGAQLLGVDFADTRVWFMANRRKKLQKPHPDSRRYPKVGRMVIHMPMGTGPPLLSGLGFQRGGREWGEGQREVVCVSDSGGAFGLLCSHWLLTEDSGLCHFPVCDRDCMTVIVDYFRPGAFDAAAAAAAAAAGGD